MLINKLDSVEVNVEDGQKYAIYNIEENENIIKYGEAIGHAICNIGKGELVDNHNMKSNLSDNVKYTYSRYDDKTEYENSELTFMGYIREDGSVGIRNDIWIVNTVGCVNKTAEKIAKITGAKYFPHPFGCSQMEKDHKRTQLILKGIVNNPNAGGVLVLGLGCENNNIYEFKKVLGEYDEERVCFLICQEVENEVEEGIKIVRELQEKAKKINRKPVNISELKVGLKCGDCDVMSVITANPLLGRFCDELTKMGGKCILTEVPEMLGAEHIIMKRCKDKETFNKTVSLINSFKQNATIYEDMLYSNEGITTLEEKSLGCIQKGGKATIVDVLNYGDTVKKSGLSLLNGPCNDIVAITNLMASGANMILFTTGNGTPIGTGVPTVKISTNKTLADKKRNWIDFDASGLLERDLKKELFDLVIEVANGKKTKNEINGYEEIAIFKDGAVL